MPSFATGGVATGENERDLCGDLLAERRTDPSVANSSRAFAVTRFVYEYVVRLRASLCNFGPPLERVLKLCTDNSQFTISRTRQLERQTLRVNHKLQPAELDQLVASYQAGASLRALSRRFQAHEQTIRRQLQQRGVTLRPGVKAPSQARLAELVASYESGRSTYDLAVELGVSADSVQRWLRHAGIPLRGRMDWRKGLGT